jgi:cell division protein FtsQ
MVLGLAVVLLTGSRLEAARNHIGAGVADRFVGLGFTVQSLQVKGAPQVAQADIMRAANLYKGQPILGVDLDAMRRRIETVGWVKQAKVLRLLPGALVIEIVPRDILAVWQDRGVDHVVDRDGKVVAEADPARFVDLPLVVGDGAAEAAAGILPLLKARPKLMGLTEALVRVDGRRWDLRLKDGGIIQLPAAGEDAALIRLDQLDQKARVLELGFERVDLRDPELVAVRPRGTTVALAGAPNARP